VAFAVGARYALVGTAVVMGPSVRLIADVYGLEGAAPYRQIQVEGEADEILKLVDRLTLAVLQLVLKTDARDLPRVDVGSVTTDSLTALKAFLRGERLFRRSEFRAAVDAYRDAIAGDSSFAMAYFRLWDAIDWRGYPAGSAEGPEDVIERLLEIRDRLPQKQRRLLAARLLRRVSTPRSAQLAYRELAMQYPDAADVWYQLGDLYYHHPATLATLEEAEHAFRMAVEHEPAFAPHRIHVIELAFQNRPDSARIAEEVAAYAALTPPTDGNRRGIEISFALGYGDEQTRTATIAALDTIDLAALIRAMDGPLLHPRFYEAFEIVRERYQQRGGRVSSWMNGEALRKRIFDQGRLREGLSEALGREEPFWPCRLLLAHQMGVPDPDGKLAFTMTLQPGDSAPSRGVWCKGLYAADVQHWADYDRVVAEFRQGRGGVDASDSTATRFLDTALAALEAYAARRRGQPQRALALLEDVYADYTWLERQPNPGADGLPLLFAIAMLHQELGHPDQAVRYLRAFRYNPLADYHLGRVYEQLDSTTEARARYEFFVTHWANADPELQPLVQDARRALGRLKGER
jgi:tetratricopeptide (TPR) repeat protein